jgi:hypothetical protein
MNEPAKIAIFGARQSPQIEALGKIFKEKQIPVQQLDIQLGPESLSQVCISKKKLTWQQVDFDCIEAVYIRGTALNSWPAMPPVNSLRQYHERRIQYLTEQEYQSVTFSFFENLVARGKLVINPLTSAYLDHDSKAQQYNKLAANGFSVPETITTNDIEQLQKFIKKNNQVIVKPMVGIGSARLVKDDDMQNFEDLAYCPSMFQQRIIGDTIRVHIVGDKVVLALKILTSEGQIDSRTNTQGFEFFQMSEKEQENIVKANRFLGLHYATWDVMISKTGRHYYLDCNPGGYIMWIGEIYSDFVLDQLANYLNVFSQTKDILQANRSVSCFQQ